MIATSSPGAAIPCSAASPAQWSSRLRSSVPKSLCTAVTPNSRLSRRTVSIYGEIASTGTLGRWAETRRAVRPLLVGTTSALRPSR